MQCVRRTFSLLAITLVTCTLMPLRAQAYPSGYGGTSSCNNCHGGGSSPTVTVTPSATTVAPGQTIPVKLSLTTPNGIYGGFSLTTGGIGTFTASGDARVLSGNATHSAPKAENASGLVEFTVSWTAPSTSQTVTFTGWGNSVNGNGSTSGDLAASATASVSVAAAPAPAPSIVLNPSALPFGTVMVGATSSLTAQVRNTGTAPLQVTQIARCASPATSTEFTWSPAGPFTVAAGGSTTVTVTYAPTNSGADAGCIAFSSNDTAHPVVSLDVSGTGQLVTASKFAVSPTSLAFGNVTTGTSATRTFTITNSGTSSVTGTIVRAAGTSAEYGLSSSSFTLAAGASQVVTVTYAPTDVGTDSGSIRVSNIDTTEIGRAHV